MERTFFHAAREQGRDAVAARIWRGAALRLALAALLVAASGALGIAALGARVAPPGAAEAAVLAPPPAARAAGTAATLAETGTAPDAERRPALRTDI